ncbi:MAG: efflux RND transporter periplasmic adaptor subunit, partial [bacterium]
MRFGVKAWRMASFWNFALMVLVLLMVPFCREKAKGGMEEKAQDGTIAIDVVRAETQVVERSVHFVGSFVAEKSVVVSSEVDGKVVEIFADVGDEVRSGQVLARLDDEEYRLMVAQAEAQVESTLSRLGLKEMPEGDIEVEETPNARRARAQLKQAEADYARVKALFEQGAVAKADMEKVETALKTAQETYKNVLDETKALVSLLKAQKAQY